VKEYLFTPFSLVFLFASFISFFTSVAAYRKRVEKGALELALLMASSGLWALIVVFEAAATTLENKIIFSKIAYFGALLTPVLFLLFVLKITGNDRYITRKNLFYIVIIPVIILILVFTNDYHSLIWKGYSPVSPNTNLSQYYHGPAFWIGYVGYTYVLFIIASIFLIKLSVSKVSSFKAQSYSILTAMSVPWIASIIYLSDLNPFPGFDLVPLSMVITGTILAISIFRNRLLGLAPIAREVLIETLKDGIVVLDQNDRIQYINESGIKYLGITKKSVIGLKLDGTECFHRKLSEAILTSEKSTLVEIDDWNTKLFYQVTKLSIKNYKGSRLIVIRDMKEEIQREKELFDAIKRSEESDRLKSSFVANLSHEIRTPINIITGFLDFLIQDDVETEAKNLYVYHIKKSTNRILATLNDIIEISKIEAGQVVLEESQINLNEIMDYLHNSFEKEASSKAIIIICEKGLDSKESLINIDRHKLVTILTNLIKNSIKFTEEGTVTFGYYKENDRLNFYVRDTGIGIPEDRKEVIFNRFVQAEYTITRPYEGSGIGLSIVKAYVEMLGGNIMLKSKLGEGSEFYFSVKYNPVIFSD